MTRDYTEFEEINNNDAIREGKGWDSYHHLYHLDKTKKNESQFIYEFILSINL
jgi:hypothetical protein